MHISIQHNGRWIECRPEAYGEGDILMTMPSRKWMKSQRMFLVPMNRFACQHLLEKFGKKMPEDVATRLRAEGHKITHKGKRLLVKDYEKTVYSELK